MKKLSLLVSTVVASALFSGCAVTPTTGFLYQNVEVAGNAPVIAETKAAAKTGESDTCVSILGLIATGNCSIENAKKNGSITNVSTVDHKRTSILGIISKGNTYITGN